jgi:hypothetical protein
MTRLTNMLKWKGSRGTISTMPSSLACRSYPSYVACISNLFSQGYSSHVHAGGNIVLPCFLFSTCQELVILVCSSTMLFCDTVSLS